MNGLILWLLFMLAFYFAYIMGMRNAAARTRKRTVETVPPLPTEKLAAYGAMLDPMLAITGQKAVEDIFEFEGHLRGRADELYPKIEAAFREESLTPMILEGKGRDEVRVVLLPDERSQLPVSTPRWWLHALLFLLTLATTTWAGALHAGVDLRREPGHFAVGLPYSIGLLLILGSHELGHYFTAKYHGIRVTPPYFVPAPFALGTFGAFIKIQSLSPNRRALFDVAIAGPLAGLVFAIPALLIGLPYSHLTPAFASWGVGGANTGPPIILALLAKVSLGISAADCKHLQLGPLAFAGWLGLMVTALNLVPIGQLDGGHIAHAVLGSRRGHDVSVIGLVLLFFLALFVWPGLMFWALIVFFIAGTRDTPAADDVTPLDLPRKVLGYCSFLLLLLIIVPVPHALYEGIGIHSPYM